MVSLVKRNRILLNEDDVFSHNAWDETEWTSEMLFDAKQRVEQQKKEAQNLAINIEEFETNVTKKWDDFYKAHEDKFFKDRKWIFSEFPELLAYLNPDSQTCNMFEVGCGVGNALAYILNSNHNAKMHIYCCDISLSAIDTLKKRDLYERENDKITAFRANIFTDFESIIKPKIQPNSLDFITIIFTLSALRPDSMSLTISNLTSLLKPGGKILFRDYAQYDLTQLRFKGKSYLGENYYARADGTTSYFFTKQLVDELFTGAGLVQIELKQDNRMLVNRLKSIKMCRCWIQAKYQKKTR